MMSLQERRLGHRQTPDTCNEQVAILIPQKEAQEDTYWANYLLGFGHPASRTGRKQISILSASESMVFYYGNPRKLKRYFSSHTVMWFEMNYYNSNLLL